MPMTEPADHIILGAPFIPDMKALGGNARRRGEWQIQALATKSAKTAWYTAFLTKAQLEWRVLPRVPFPWQLVDIALYVALPDRRSMDIDNLVSAYKPLLDVLCMPSGAKDVSWRLGVIEDDDVNHVRSLSVYVSPGPQPPSTLVEIRRVK